MKCVLFLHIFVSGRRHVALKASSATQPPQTTQEESHFQSRKKHMATHTHAVQLSSFLPNAAAPPHPEKCQQRSIY